MQKHIKHEKRKEEESFQVQEWKIVPLDEGVHFSSKNKQLSTPGAKFCDWGGRSGELYITKSPNESREGITEKLLGAGFPFGEKIRLEISKKYMSINWLICIDLKEWERWNLLPVRK